VRLLVVDDDVSVGKLHPHRGSAGRGPGL